MGTILFFVLILPIIGAIFGFLARAIVPGDDPMSLGQTILLGIVGSYVGGALGYVLFGADRSEGLVQPGGIVGSLVGSIIALLVWRQIQKNKVG